MGHGDADDDGGDGSIGGQLRDSTMSHTPQVTGEDTKHQIIESEPLEIPHNGCTSTYVFSSGIFLPHHSVSLPDLKKKLVLWSSGFSRLFCCQCMGVGGWGDEDWITLNFLPDTFHLSRTQIPGLPALQFPKYQEFSGNAYSEEASYCFYWITPLEIHLTKPNLLKQI